MYEVKLSKRAQKDLQKLKQSGLSKKAKSLVDIMKENPWQNPPPYEKLVGDLNGFYSRRINVQHRLVYKVFEEDKVVAIYSMWTHYE
ncbi:MAG: Txe/YoeB family addiction module toxin [Clostridiales bacterium]|uniref:Txe/YoeB family addiction module toxin n=1 Tax=Candidatus Fimivicinus sp. TaxID=3056640 RepID=UPI001DC68907|nr:Txe/YoeB family addiction module toxin [Clostridiales bacterium]